MRPPERDIPHSDEAERGFLSSILQQPLTTLSSCADRVAPEHFYNSAHRLTFESLWKMWDEKTPIDLISVTQRLRDEGSLEMIGGAYELTVLLNFAPTAANADYYLQMMRAKFIRREMIRVGTELVRKAYEENAEEMGLLDEAQATITGLALESLARTTLRHVADGVQETVAQMEKAFRHRGDETITGLASGLVDIDRMTGGFRKQQLILIGARTNQGKSALALNIAVHLAKGVKRDERKWRVPPVPVAYFSLEMSYEELSARYTCQGTGISLQRLRDGKFSREVINSLPEAIAPLLQAPVYIDDRPQLTIADFKAAARRAAVNERIGCFVIDYLQLMRSLTRRAQQNKVIEIGEITAGLKAIAKELNVPVIACAQLNRDPEKRPMGKPKLSDLRESGSMENDADTVILLWRPEKQCDTDKQRVDMAKKLSLEGEDDAESIRNLESYAEAILAKQRNGPTGRVRLRFQGELTQFQSMTGKMWSNKDEERQVMLED